MPDKKIHPIGAPEKPPKKLSVFQQELADERARQKAIRKAERDVARKQAEELRFKIAEAEEALRLKQEAVCYVCLRLCVRAPTNTSFKCIYKMYHILIYHSII